VGIPFIRGIVNAACAAVADEGPGIVRAVAPTVVVNAF
jgi:hypothetical protein